MTIIYYIAAVLIAIGLYFIRKPIFQVILSSSFVATQWGFNIIAILHFRKIDVEFFTFDSLGLLLLTTLSIITIPAFIHSFIYLKHRNDSLHVRAIYLAAMVVLLASISAAYFANHIAVLWIFVELTTLAASALIYHHRTKLSLEGTWKYVFICAISITFVFIGILFLSLALEHTGSSDLSYSNLFFLCKDLDPFWLKLAFIFIFTGFTAKLGLVPMYTAGIDAKDNAPSPAGAILASVLMNLGFLGIFRFYAVVANTTLLHWANLIIIIAASISIFVATVYMSKVMNIKRMFAYSGIEHMGIVMLGIAAGGIGYYAAILHIILHAFVKSGLFFQINQIFRIYKTKNIFYIGNYFKYNPSGAIVLLIGFLCATAIPPSGLFICEFYIFNSLFAAKYYILLIVILMFLTIIIWAFGKNVFKIIFTPVAGFEKEEIIKINSWENISQFLLFGLVIYLGLFPPTIFVELIQDAISILPK